MFLISANANVSTYRQRSNKCVLLLSYVILCMQMFVTIYLSLKHKKRAVAIVRLETNFHFFMQKQGAIQSFTGLMTQVSYYLLPVCYFIKLEYLK